MGAVVSYDTAVATDKGRWSDWLHLANVVQYLDDDAIITSTRSHLPDLTSVTPQPPAGADDTLLNEILDKGAMTLVRGVVAAGFTDFEVGMGAGDPDDTPIEVVWPAARIGILGSGTRRPITLEDWDLRHPEQWSVDELVKRLGEDA